uniref:DH domain-containing protein n=2 Tax=Parascaris univalens TaxID=6257 RepID=A0A915A292_PARUN
CCIALFCLDLWRSSSMDREKKIAHSGRVDISDSGGSLITVHHFLPSAREIVDRQVHQTFCHHRIPSWTFLLKQEHACSHFEGNLDVSRHKKKKENRVALSDSRCRKKKLREFVLSVLQDTMRGWLHSLRITFVWMSSKAKLEQSIRMTQTWYSSARTLSMTSISRICGLVVVLSSGQLWSRCAPQNRSLYSSLERTVRCIQIVWPELRLHCRVYQGRDAVRRPVSSVSWVAAYIDDFRHV